MAEPVHTGHPLYRLVWSDGDAIDYTGESESMLAQIRRQYPGDETGYLRFVGL